MACRIWFPACISAFATRPAPFLVSSIYVRGLKTGRAWKDLCAAKEARVAGELFNDLQRKFDSGLYVKASQLNKLLDNCNTAEDFDLAVQAVREFRKSLSKARDSTSSIFVRTSCRVGAPGKALEVIQDKLQYGIFPTIYGFNMLIKEFLRMKDYESAIKTFHQIENDEIKPSALTYNMIIRAYCFKETVEGYNRALQLVEELERESIDFLYRTRHCVAATACRQEDPETCLKIISGIETQAAIGLEIRALAMKGQLEEAIRKLSAISADRKIPAKSVEGLKNAVDNSGVKSLQVAFQETLKMKSQN